MKKLTVDTNYCDIRAVVAWFDKNKIVYKTRYTAANNQPHLRTYLFPDISDDQMLLFWMKFPTALTNEHHFYDVPYSANFLVQ
jgi:hypothetical protein